MELKELLLEYKKITKKIIEEVAGECNIEPLVLKREDILSKIKTLGFKKEDFREIATELRILEIEEELHQKMEEEKDIIRTELDKIERIKKANRNYSNNMAVPNFFNKKI